jgi:2-aminoadipate transaminase
MTTMSTIWTEQLSFGANRITGSALRDLLKVAEETDMISFAGGFPAPECFPTEELAAAAERVLVEHSAVALQYGPAEGYRRLRSFLTERMASLDVPVCLEQILVTSGSQQALDIIGKLFIDPGALVIVEEPTYLGALQAWQPYNPRYVTLAMDEDGLDVDALARLLESGERPRFLYLVSCFQNPTGITLSLERRHALIKLAAHYRLPIVEDDPYGDLYYSGGRIPLVAALDAELSGELRQVMYLGTFSKLLAPGLRVGWMVAPAEVMDKLVCVKQGLDLQCGSLAQAIAYEACRDGLLERHIPTIRSTYHARRDVMLSALEEYMGTEVTWTHPEGGLFIWLTLPTHVDATTLLRAARTHKVAFVPGSAFFPNGGGANTVRLNFSYPSPARIVEGVMRLKCALDEQLP